MRLGDNRNDYRARHRVLDLTNVGMLLILKIVRTVELRSTTGKGIPSFKTANEKGIIRGSFRRFLASLFPGYYRINYDTVNWLLLATRLAEDPSQFPLQSKAQIINDAFAIASSGHLDIVVALETLNFLQKEKALIVWQSAIKIVKKMYDFIGPTAVNPLFEVNSKSI